LFLPVVFVGAALNSRNRHVNARTRQQNIGYPRIFQTLYLLQTVLDLINAAVAEFDSLPLNFVQAQP
jgi:hypothetical protein